MLEQVGKGTFDMPVGVDCAIRSLEYACDHDGVSTISVHYFRNALDHVHVWLAGDEEGKLVRRLSDGTWEIFDFAEANDG